MTRGTRMMLVLLILIGMVMLMMDCAKKSLKHKKPPKATNGNSQGWNGYKVIWDDKKFAYLVPPNFLTST
jgi:hypothetical protein